MHSHHLERHQKILFTRLATKEEEMAIGEGLQAMKAGQFISFGPGEEIDLDKLLS